MLKNQFKSQMKFFNACKVGDINCVKQMILNPKPSERVILEKSTSMPAPLELAISYGHLDILKFLLETSEINKDISIGSLNMNGNNVLTLCMLKDFEKGFNYLISHYNFENIFSNEEIVETLFRFLDNEKLDWFKSFCNNININQYMLETNNSMDENLLIYSLRQKNSDFFSYLLSKIEGKSIVLSNFNFDGYPEFFSPLYHDNVELLKLLLSSEKINKIDLYSKNLEEEDILVTAALMQAENIMNYLIFELNFDFEKGTSETIKKNEKKIDILLEKKKIRDNKISLEKIIDVSNIAKKNIKKL